MHQHPHMCGCTALLGAASPSLRQGGMQVNYALGNITGISYMAGHGQNPPTYLYHKSSYNSWIDFPLRQTSRLAFQPTRLDISHRQQMLPSVLPSGKGPGAWLGSLSGGQPALELLALCQPAWHA